MSLETIDLYQFFQAFLKILKKVAYRRLNDYLMANSILSDSQYGFRSNHSTFMALLEMPDKISKSLDDGNITAAVFIDLSKAFDTINHDVLCRKLEFYGVRGIALQWFIDYLSNRKQCVYYNGVASDFMNIPCGVPQGSVLGPLLFIIYVMK